MINSPRTTRPFFPAFLALFILLSSISGFAQDAPEATEPQEQTQPEKQQSDSQQDSQPTADQHPDQQPEQQPLAPLEDPAWQLYQQAFVETLRGHQNAAENLLNQLIQEYPRHEAVPLVHRILAVMSLVQAEQPSVEQDQQPEPAQTPTESVADQKPKPSQERTLANGETTNAQARAELAIFQTIHGLGVGLETCLFLECDDPRPVFAALTVGAGLGLAGSLYFSRDGVTAGQASSYNTGTTWGFWSGLALANTLDLETKAFIGTLLGGQAIGLGGAALAWHLFEPTAGTVSFASSGALWATVITTFIHGTTGFEASRELLWGSLLAAAPLGLVTGALLANEFPMTRGRALVIDSGGILGALVGFASYVLIAGGGDEPDGKAAMASGLAGTVAGLGIATYFSRHWDFEDETSTQLFINPTDGGALVGLGGKF